MGDLVSRLIAPISHVITPIIPIINPPTRLTLRVLVGIGYILRAQRGSQIPTLKPKYIPYNYMDPLGVILYRLHGDNGKKHYYFHV